MLGEMAPRPLQAAQRADRMKRRAQDEHIQRPRPKGAFVLHDTNRGVRLFGTNNANRDQYNLVFFDQTEKNTNSLLNTFKDRHQNTVIANYYRQDFLTEGYTISPSFHASFAF